jgi:predicted secreted hydrolase
VVTPAPTRAAANDPQPIILPRDDGPHDRLTEWWYYTGHLGATDGRHFGFEFVIFRAERGSFPISWASHLALTDEAGNHFMYDQKSQIGPAVDLRAPDQGGFDLAIGGTTPSEPIWRMTGLVGRDRLDVHGTQFALALDLTDTRSAPVLHDGDGWVDFGPAGGSYYYSRPRMSAAGELVLERERLAVQGTAWFDHQWGDFIAVGSGGWDWFAVNLDDGTDLTLSLVRAADGSLPLVYGTLASGDGSVRHLARDQFSVTAIGSWTSPRTGAAYPAGWRINVPDAQLTIDLTPTVTDQELDTRPTTGVIYWEGSQIVSATRDGSAVGGEAYVELTGYAPPSSSSP